MAMRLPSAKFAKPIGPTAEVLLRDDKAAAYPILDGFPVLMAPEVLVPPAQQREVDLSDPKYAEAYAEMAFYNRAATERMEGVEASSPYAELERVLQAPSFAIVFPEPKDVWLDARLDAAAQWDVYVHMAPLAGKAVLQLGGSGGGVVKFLLAGAREGWLLTPMVGEARFARALATACGVGDQFRAVVGVAEELPFSVSAFDRVYSGGCLHHMDTSVALPEVARVLSEAGRFGAIDPWRAPLYAIGTRIFGQREAKVFGERDIGVFCRPLTTERMQPLSRSFSHARVIQHGALSRYPLVVLHKFGLQLPLAITWFINRIDDAISSRIPGLRRWGSSAAVIATK